MNVEGINSISFNHNLTCFSCCTETGVRIFNVYPLSGRARFDLGGITKCEVLNPSNFIAIISGGKNAKYCQNTVMIYDCLLRKFVTEIVCASGVKSVLMRRNTIIVVTVDKISVFTFPTDFTHILDLDTCMNPKGLCVIPPSESLTSIMAYPGNKIGSIHIMDILNLEFQATSSPSILNAHHREISCLAINRLGTLIASASSKGTLIKIWNIQRKVKVAQLKLELGSGILYCINFSPNSELLCCSSDKGTVNVFEMIKSNLNGPSCSSTLSLSTSFCELQKALAIFTVPTEVRCICTFLFLDTVAAICPDGNYHTFKFCKDGTSHRTSLRMYLFSIY